MKNTEINRNALTPEELENVNGGLLPIVQGAIMAAETIIGFAVKQVEKKVKGGRRRRFKKGLTYKKN